MENVFDDEDFLNIAPELLLRQPQIPPLSLKEEDRVVVTARLSATQRKLIEAALSGPTRLSEIPEARKFVQTGESIIFVNAVHFGDNGGSHRTELTEDQKKEEVAFFGEISLDELFGVFKNSNEKRSFISQQIKRRIFPPFPIRQDDPEYLKTDIEPLGFETSTPLPIKPETLPGEERKRFRPKNSNLSSDNIIEIDPNSPEGIKNSFFELLKAGDVNSALTFARIHRKIDFIIQIHRAVIWAFENSNPNLANTILNTFSGAKTDRFIRSLKIKKYQLD